MTRSRPLVGAALLLALAGCATPPQTTKSGPLPPTATQCNADAASAAVGQPATAAVVEQVRRDSGARVVRVLHPGQMITMEFSGDRVNVRVDGDNRILAITCG